MSIYIAALCDVSHFKAAVQLYGWPPTIRSAEWLPTYPTPLLWCNLPPPSSRSRYQFILLGEQRHMCVPRIAPGSGTARNQTLKLSITNLTPYHYTTKPHKASLEWCVKAQTVLMVFLVCCLIHESFFSQRPAAWMTYRPLNLVSQPIYTNDTHTLLINRTFKKIFCSHLHKSAQRFWNIMDPVLSSNKPGWCFPNRRKVQALNNSWGATMTVTNNDHDGHKQWSGSDDPSRRYGHLKFSQMRDRSVVGQSVLNIYFLHWSHILLFTTLGT